MQQQFFFYYVFMINQKLKGLTIVQFQHQIQNQI